MLNLILVNIFGEFSLSKFIESDDDQGNKDVDEEEGKDYKVDDVEDGHFGPETSNGSFILVSRGHRALQDTGRSHFEIKSVTLFFNRNPEWFIRILPSDLLHPSFRGLNSKEGDHGCGTVVVVEGPNLPDASLDNWGSCSLQPKNEKLSPGIWERTINFNFCTIFFKCLNE